ncbi:MOSC domain-containing protein [Mycobacterium sp. NAZ190054]|uniref:MOSC domain-containing protein n=1 Tax=Mycobacterium sp. NAZ190054 TaxID=1747766 RepID=UPI0007987A09|nr:MOSC N-terminal beta barrel domain-containing protein [Mycobacterium sp. NAZ190054]KWX66415.1 molybdenum cofactor biosysynthesis protein [Mycobacterium sp. NAZ190054]
MSATTEVDVVGRVATLRRYPVKSMLGERCGSLDVTPLGVAGDRRYAFTDDETGRVATAKNPRLWRRLLQCSAVTGDDGVVVTLPDGRSVPVGESAGPVSELVGRRVHLADERSAGATVERSDPIEVLTHGLDAEIEAALLEIAQGTPGGAFVDHSPVHLITTATLDAVGLDPAEAVRYRPNIVIETPDGFAPFTENEWVGATIRLGDVEMRGTMPTPRCSVPTLEHGSLPRSPQSVRHVLEHNRVDAPGFGVLPCAGLYAEVVTGGTIAEGAVVGLARHAGLH